MNSPSSAKAVFELLHDDLRAIEEEFCWETRSSSLAIREIGEYLRAGGGKRIRPMLVLLASRLFSANGNAGVSAIRLGAVMEIIHTATLVHDDIIDEAQTRRGRPSANTQWGNAKCVLAGDWLYMQAFKVAVQERNFRLLDVLLDLTQQMVEGEMLQMEGLGRCVSRQEYLDLIFRKTACLFSVCLRLGGILAQVSPEQEESLAAYGRNLGLAFQIVDDVLDLTASEEILGKPVASDLREGKTTLAVIATLERCTPEERQLIETVLHEGAFRSVTHERIIELLNHYGGVETAMDAARQYAAQACQALSGFPSSEARKALLWVPDFVIARNS